MFNKIRKLKMNYNETISFLFEQLAIFQNVGIKAFNSNLNNIHELDKHLDFPHKKYKTVHVAGTNGKGSVSHLLASVLQSANYKVGLYTSPHLKDFRERIKINGQCIKKQSIIDFVDKNLNFIKTLKPSFFELTVAMAFDYFAKENIDIAIIEVGLGGRLDATNIITPLLSIITNISLDHTHILGDTLEKISYEKAGIIKKNIPLIIGETQKENKNIFIEKANNLNSEIYFADENYHSDYQFLNLEGKQTFNFYKDKTLVFENLRTDLLGFYQKKNIVTSLQSLEILKKTLKISKKNIFEGIENVSKKTALLGRWEILGNNPLIVADNGHNEAGIKQIIFQIQQTPHKKLHFILGMVNDKNIDNILSLLPKNAKYYFTQANIYRALESNILKEKAKVFNLKGESFASVKNAFLEAKTKAQKNDLIFIGGSSFVVAEII